MLRSVIVASLLVIFGCQGEATAIHPVLGDTAIGDSDPDEDAPAVIADNEAPAVVLVDLPPVAVIDLEGPLTLGRSTVFELDGAKSHDPEGLPVAFAWTLPSGYSAADLGLTLDDLSHASIAPKTPATLPSAALIFGLTVTDDHGKSHQSSIAVTVVNLAPVLRLFGSESVAQTVLIPRGLLKSLDFSASHDPDGEPFTLSFTGVVATTCAGSNDFSFHAGATAASLTLAQNPITAACQGSGPFTLTVQAYDGSANSALMTVTILLDVDYYSPQIGDHGDEGNPGGATRLEPVVAHRSDWSSVSPTFFDKVILGNASYAHAVTYTSFIVDFHEFLYARAYQQYIHNVNYTFPSVVNVYAAYAASQGSTPYFDEFFAMNPAVTASRGASGSEIEFVTLGFNALSAMNPAAKAKMKQHGLIIPTLQMLWRRTRPGIEDDADYLTGAAHPSAFPPKVGFASKFWKDEAARYIQMAGEIQSDDIPPMVQLSVVEDEFTGVVGKDYFEDSKYTEHLYDTPVSIARLYRGREYTKSMTVSAANSYDINDRPLTYAWAVLRGDPTHVRITPLDVKHSVVKIEFDYHTTRPYLSPDGTELNSNLAVVGAFVHNGAYYSAPAYVTSYTMSSEVRTYDDEGRMASVLYTGKTAMSDINVAKNWTSDVFRYDSDGDLLGWKRSDGKEFTKEGYLVVTQNAGRVPLTADLVTYAIPPEAKWKGVCWTAQGAPFAYTGSKPLVFGADPMAIAQGASTKLSWSVPGASSVTLDHGLTAGSPIATTTLSPTVTTTYTLTVVVGGETKMATVTVEVLPPPTVTLATTANHVALGEAPLLSWSTSDATSVVIEPGIGPVEANGIRSILPTATTTYTITVAGSGGASTAQVTVTLD